MHLLYPIGLIALAGLLIPLIIHLWKLKQGKTLRIGSIALLGASSPFTSRSYQITDWLLLFLRILLIVLLAFLLSEPYLKREKNEGIKKGWVLLEKSQLPSVYKTHKQELDSLIQAGYELHDFGSGFQKIRMEDTLKNEKPDAASHQGLNSSITTSAKISHYALLRELNAQLQPNFPVYLFADRKLQSMGGNQAQVDFRLVWKEIAGKDTLATWSSSFAHKTFEAKSSPEITAIKRMDEVQDEAKTKVLIYGTEHPEDVKYLRAAIEAIAQETKRNIEVSMFNGKNVSGLSFDIGFWISNKPVSSGFLAQLSKDGRLFNYAGEKVTSINSWVEVGPGTKGNMPAIPLNKRTVDTTDQGAVLWTDGFGVPLLTRSKEKTLNHYRFYSRINPQWTSLVWNEKFVEAMMPVLLGEDGSLAGFGFEVSPDDERRSSLKSATGSLAGQSASTAHLSVADQSSLPAASQQEQPLKKVFWLTALLVFTLERIISLHHKNKLNHG
ncbi:BatA domain-containing protein [Pedobacter gandavensis]|uniref:BatA domain-containing protein n=1 Tax=Pedobacter gandavensis TaxID=2679963 RepID=UPI00247AC803|nr:BatA domain-containing protein [Pedobacter gandavensis]WGQ10375.1 BatA domain-containing protein [Pedobacter gandavensis]